MAIDLTKKVNYPLPQLPWIVDGAGNLIGFQHQSGQVTYFVTDQVLDGLTALAGGGQSGATPLTGQINRVATVVTSGDSVLLPSTATGQGQRIAVINDTNTPLAVFPQVGDLINGQAANVSVTQNPNSIEFYVSPTAGKWFVEIGTGYSGSFFTESAIDTVTANAAGTQAAATLLTGQTARITTAANAASPYSAIKLPPSAPGLELLVINHAANPIQVFGSGTDQIDDVATATGVTQMPNSLVIYTCATSGNWYTEGLATGYAGNNLQTLSFVNAITARAGGGQSLATALTAMVNRITTVATAGDSVVLPASVAGLMLTVINSAANPMQVFGLGTDTINGVATATGISQAPNSIYTYLCTVAGLWQCESVGGGFAGQLATQLTTNTISAAGTTQGTATALNAMVNRVTTVAANAGVILPTSAAGLMLTVINAGANPLNVYPDTGSAINNLSANLATPLPVGQTMTIICPVAGAWFTLPVSPREVNTAIATVGAGTLTAAALVGSVITRSGSTAAYTDTTDTAANIIAALHGATIGQAWEVTIKNTVNFSQTLAAGVGVTLSGQTIIPPNSVGRFLLTYSAAGAVTIQGLAMSPMTTLLSQAAYNAVAGNTPLTLTAANMAGQNDITVNLTAALAGAGTVTTDTAANLVAQIPNAQVGQTYKLRIINSSSGAFAWTVAAGTGVTLAGTMTIAQNTWRDFVVTLTSLTAVSMQSTGTGTFS